MRCLQDRPPTVDVHLSLAGIEERGIFADEVNAWCVIRRQGALYQEDKKRAILRIMENSPS